ncbi:recombinase family protein [Bradyrhizobium sp. BR 1433]|uniref:recombinase family protein n=1 Tax=Bradyrhizobium sp. BR 1433 TaxID=3447967 RepID=UPI003EE53B03
MSVTYGSAHSTEDRSFVGIHLRRTFTDHASGKDTDCPVLAQLVVYVREGDTVVVRSMDRLARNLEDLRRLVRELTAKGVGVQFLKGKPHIHC